MAIPGTDRVAIWPSAAASRTSSIDAQVFTEEVFDFAERDRADELFEEIGFRVREVRDAPPARAFRFRFPWLLATVASGAACALIVTAFQATLARAMVLASFLALALALAESVSIQSMTIALQALHARKASWRSFLPQVRREGLTAVLIAAACGAITFLLVWAVQRAAEPAFAIGASVAIGVVSACLYGLVVPTVLHRFRLEPKIAAGPLALALTDVTTLLVYFTLGSLVL